MCRLRVWVAEGIVEQPGPLFGIRSLHLVYGIQLRRVIARLVFGNQLAKGCGASQAFGVGVARYLVEFLIALREGFLQTRKASSKQDSRLRMQGKL